MNRRGVGPNQLGSPLKKTDPPSEKPDPENTYDLDAFNNRTKATGGIKVDNTIESLFMGGALVKGIQKALGAGAGAVGAARAAGAVGSRAAHGIGEAAHVGEVAHSAMHMRKIKK